MKRLSLVAMLALALASSGCAGDNVCEAACDHILACGADECTVKTGCGEPVDQCQARCVVDAPCSDVLLFIVAGGPQGALKSCFDACIRDPTPRDGGVSDGGNRSSYQSYRTAGGPYCGADSGNRESFCMPGDDCRDLDANQCGPSILLDAYRGYRDAGGPVCGIDGGNRETFCLPGDSCQDEASNLCSR